MIAELGHLALAAALVVAVFQTVVPLYGAARRDSTLMEMAQPAALVQFAALIFAFGALTHAFVTSDFSVSNVAENSHSLKPMLYKVSGVWGNHEGSMLLWVLILSLFGAAVAAFGGNLPESLRARTIAIQGLIGIGFLAFILFTSNPFERVIPAPIDGRGLNPLLQDIGLALHPPMLYLGYVGLSTTFSFAVAALLEGRVDPSWARWVRPWTLAAWVALTAGITLGSGWAYYELGWGGWWFWDPVENASFMPWLAATALLHSAIVVEKRDALKSWTILLALIAFALSLLGTFLVRSGVLTSVHAFAVDPERGMFILVLLAIAIGGSFALYAWRAPTMEGGGVFRPISREGGLVLNNLLNATGAATVLIGTLYPLALETVTGEKVSVGPPFFEATFVPLMVPLIIALGIGPMLAWKRGDLAGALHNLWAAAIIAICVGMALAWLQGAPVGAALGMALAAWLAIAVLTEWADRVRLFRVPLSSSLSRAAGLPRSAYGMTLAHFGLAVFIVGAVGETYFSAEVVRYAAPGDKVEIAGHTLTFEGVTERAGPNFNAQVGSFVLEDGHRLESERRFFPAEGQQTTEAAIRVRPAGDLYTVLGEPADGDRWTIRVYYKTLVMWIWVGGFLMSLGGLVSLADRRLRVGAPAPRRARMDLAAAGGDD
ncbi:heme lyase CcmF/NrfE family subunit [Thalassobaculum sp. OXR-137]|uniref:heme lyase CcmF/NrfE family subunit n=1 Tax=Thalassobaculum sp. OXR-137 TaxID=3100173 RepID=UPI002AC8EDAA|nr:heme lyase CcmF/NrfE family subunit [Thalassobaculum sp. OXR-137]WPZ36020.1 heme lyase CcmF/NrfE family subunit [Thalassobaculum sp. OXR-137]